MRLNGYIKNDIGIVRFLLQNPFQGSTFPFDIFRKRISSDNKHQKSGVNAKIVHILVRKMFNGNNLLYPSHVRNYFYQRTRVPESI